MTKIAVINADSGVTDEEIQKWMQAVATQVANEFFDAWAIAGVDMRFIAAGDKPTPDEWWMTCLPNSDVADALGYHDLTPTGQPLGKVFVETTLKDGMSASVCFDHEMLELLVDPYIQLAAQARDGRLYSYEVCLAEETRIALADGQTPTIKELCAWKDPIVVRGCDATGRVRTARACWPRLTLERAQVVRITFTDGSFVRCTPNHRFLTEFGKYREAGLLRAGMTLRSNVLPAMAIADARDSGDGYPIADGEHLESFRAVANGDDLFVGELRSSAAFPAPISGTPSGHTAFARSIEHVFPMRSRKEMLRVAAFRYVAGMTHLDSSGDRGLVHFVGHSMGEQHLSAITDLSISRSRASASPYPTAIGLQNPRMEDIGQRGLALVVGGKACEYRARAVLPRPMSSTQTLRSKWSDTVGNGTRLHGKVIHAVELDGNADVYDLTVPGLKNFALEAGVFAHNCDAVEADECGYRGVNGVLLSDFVLPAWFCDTVMWTPGTKYSFNNKAPGAFNLAKGGYISVFQNGGWSQINADKHAESRRPKVGSRRERRAVGRDVWRLSTKVF